MERLGDRARRVLRPQPEARLRAHDGLGPGRPVRPWAGHDINYISLAGALAHIGRAGEAPVPPLNLVGDFGGGGMFLAFGVVCALLEAQRSGQGQVVDAAMVDGTATLMSMFWSMSQAGVLEPGGPRRQPARHRRPLLRRLRVRRRRVHLARLDRAAVLRRAAAPHRVSTGDEEFAKQMDKPRGRRSRQRLAEVFKGKTRDEWCALMEHTDVCFAPVLTMAEAAEHPHNIARRMIVERDGLKQPAPAPRFSRTVPEITRVAAAPRPGHTARRSRTGASPRTASTRSSRTAPSSPADPRTCPRRSPVPADPNGQSACASIPSAA